MKGEMKTLGITPTRWFDSGFEVPVLRRIPRCRQEAAGQTQAKQNLMAHLRRRRRRCPFPVEQCRREQCFISQTI